MAQFKCIGCGKIMAQKAECACPVCGCNMYALPYNRSDILRKEIIRFIDRILENPITADDLCYQTSGRDFPERPDIDKIRPLLSASSRSELFQKLINAYTSKVLDHAGIYCSADYQISWKNLQAKLAQNETLLLNVLSQLDITASPGTIPAPELKKTCKAGPSPVFYTRAQALAMNLNRLTRKICDVKAQYFISDEEFWLVPDAYNLPEIEDGKYWLRRLPAIMQNIDNALARNYAPPLGVAELQDMMGVVLESLLFFHNAAIQRGQAVWYVDREAFDCEADFLARINQIAAKRFKDVRKSVHDVNFLYGMPEKQLFALYQKLQGIDAASAGSAKSGQPLDVLVGLNSVKASIRKIRAYTLANKDSKDLNLHMCFFGNPGTGKTEVARIIAGILHENGLLPTNKVVETDRSGLIAGYVGQTAIKTTELIQEAMGGVLFIDEAYSLVQGDNDFGHEAIATLLKAMEDHRGKFCVILAGYQIPMQEMLATNPGFRSRIQFHLHFPDYSRSELEQIAELMLRKRNYTISRPALDKLLDITDVQRKAPNFANARELRNLLDQVIMCQNLRCVGTTDREIALGDVSAYIRDSRISVPKNDEGTKILSAEEELDALVGLSAVKRMVRKIKAYARRNRENADFNLHMCFYGNPGTGKTEVARILSRLLYDAGVLPEAKLVETDAHGLIGKVVGETAPKTRSKVNEAVGGVLFIDEAYSLAGDSKSSDYGEEAVSVLLKEMEDKRGQFCVILAGYKKEMKRMIGTNPGLSSRIQFSLDFPDYSKEELAEIALAILHKKKYRIAEDALALVLDICEYYRGQPDFANARTVRNILEQAIMNQNLRTESFFGSDDLIIREDVEEYMADEHINPGSGESKPGKIGF